MKASRNFALPALIVLSLVFLTSAAGSAPVQASQSSPPVVERLSRQEATDSRNPEATEHTAVIEPLPAGDETYDIVQIFPSTDHSQSETSICVNPNDPDHLLVGVNAITTGGSTDFHQGYYYTFDRGATWGGSNILPGANSAGDPVVWIDLNGNAYFNYITWISGMECWVKKSTDGGVNWLGAVEMPNAGSTDKCHMAVDFVPTSPYRDNVYASWTDFYDWPYSVKLSRSTDGGASFTSAVEISGNTANYLAQGVNLSVGAAGEVYATWSIYNDYVLEEVGNGFTVSTNGGASWGTAFQIPGLNVNGIRGYLKSTGIRVNSFPAMDVDLAKDIIYLVWTDERHGDPDIFLTKSYDGGGTWSTPPVRINDDPLGNGIDQWFPWVAVSEDGVVGVVFYDSRHDPGNLLTTVYVAISNDEGESWDNIRVMDDQFVPTPIPGCATGYQGDYIGIAARDGSFFPCWCMPEPTTGIYQAYFADVPFTVADVSISVDPDMTEVRRGEIISYGITVENNTDQLQSFFVESEVEIPGGRIFPVIEPVAVNLNPYETKSRNIGNRIPMPAPLGTYTYTVFAFRDGGEVIDQDSFDFEVIP